MDDEERPLTEAEYREWMEHRMRELAAEFNDGLLQEARDAGIRIEWAPGVEPPEHNGIADPEGVIAGFPRLPYGEWTPMRNVFARWRSGPVCYPLPSGNMVHVKPGCRCAR